MDAPQSGEDVTRFIAALHLLDEKMGVRWEPRAVLVRRGGYTVTGQVIDPVWRGLWELTRDDKAFGTANWRNWTRVCFVTRQVEVAPGIMAMEQDGAYAPLDESVLTFLRQADKQNQEGARRLQERLDKLNERNDLLHAMAGSDGERELLERMYHAGTKAGGGVSEFHPVKIELAKR